MIGVGLTDFSGAQQGVFPVWENEQDAFFAGYLQNATLLALAGHDDMAAADELKPVGAGHA
jgi:hypothetical protein